MADEHKCNSSHVYIESNPIGPTKDGKLLLNQTQHKACNICGNIQSSTYLGTTER